MLTVKEEERISEDKQTLHSTKSTKSTKEVQSKNVQKINEELMLSLEDSKEIRK